MAKDDVALLAGLQMYQQRTDDSWARIPRVTNIGAMGDQAEPKEKSTLEDKKRKYGDGLTDAQDKNIQCQYIPEQKSGDKYYDDYVLQQEFMVRCQNREEFNIRVDFDDGDINGFFYKSLGFSWDEGTQGDWKMFTVNGKQNSFLILGVTVSGTATVASSATTQLTAAWVPMMENEPGDITWSSSDEAVATVDENGLVTGVAAGTVTITATIRGVPGTLEVEVTA